MEKYLPHMREALEMVKAEMSRLLKMPVEGANGHPLVLTSTKTHVSLTTSTRLLLGTAPRNVLRCTDAFWFRGG